MRYTLALALAGALVVAPGVGVLAAQAKPVTKTTKAAVGSHATRGVVTSIDATTLVISRPGRQGAMTFEMSAATARDGMPAVGSPVSIRYREEGSKHVATAITVQHAKKAGKKPA